MNHVQQFRVGYIMGSLEVSITMLAGMLMVRHVSISNADNDDLLTQKKVNALYDWIVEHRTNGMSNVLILNYLYDPVDQTDPDSPTHLHQIASMK